MLIGFWNLYPNLPQFKLPGVPQGLGHGDSDLEVKPVRHLAGTCLCHGAWEGSSGHRARRAGWQGSELMAEAGKMGTLPVAREATNERMCSRL